MSSKLWSRSTVYTTFADGRGLPPQVEITHSAKVAAEAFGTLSETYPYVRTTFEHTTWILGIQVVARGDLRKKAGHLAAAASE